MSFEYCCNCDEPTGGAGKGEDSLYVDDGGPYCPSCYDLVRVKAENKRLRDALKVFLIAYLGGKKYISMDDAKKQAEAALKGE